MINGFHPNSYIYDVLKSNHNHKDITCGWS